jgi:spore maturation protein CgeB
MKISRIIITGASPDQTNRNTVLRSYVAEGFQQLLGFENVTHCPLEQSVSIVHNLKPDLVLCFGSCMPDDADYFALRHACDKTSSALVFWLHDDPYEFDFNYKVCDLADYIFSNDKWASLHYDHEHAFHMPLAASKAAHWRPLNTAKNIDLFFCGVAFPNRIRLMADLKHILKKYKSTILGDQWPDFLNHTTTNKRLSNDELSNHYTQSKFTLNLGRDFNYANDRYKLVPSTPGPRTFEAAMAGTTQLYFVESLEIEDYYVPNKEIILFDSTTELEFIIQKFFDGQLSASSIQANAQARTLNDHTYYARARSIISTIETKN